MRLRALIGCEFSGRVREAFRSRGHDAWSCDIEPAEDGSPHHYQVDLREVLDRYRWDLFIAHPPCTYLTVSGNRWEKQWPDRVVKREAAANFIADLWNIATRRKIPMALENPVGRLSTMWRRPDQIVQPWWFGDRKIKPTCLWLYGLRRLKPTDMVGPPPKVMTLEEKKSWNECHHEAPGPDRQKNRSRTYQGFANAMAEQWGELSGWYSEEAKHQQRLFPELAEAT